MKIIDNPWIQLLARWILGAVFVYASYHKIIEPAAFAKIIYGYDLFPAISINIIAIVLPYLELFTGLALIIGIHTRGAGIIISGMLFSFIIALSINLIRGHEFDCGCIGFGDAGHVSSTVQLLARDIVMFIIGLSICISKKPEKFKILGFGK